MRNGPLDMRMNPHLSRTAADIINGYSEEELTHIFREYGEEPAARRIASLIVKARKSAPFSETLALARAIEKLIGRHGRLHPATRVFQALFQRLTLHSFTYDARCQKPQPEGTG